MTDAKGKTSFLEDEARFISAAQSVQAYMKSARMSSLQSEDWQMLAALYDLITRGPEDEAQSIVDPRSLQLRRRVSGLSFSEAVGKYCALAETLCDTSGEERHA